MYNLLIVDDESIIVEGLSTLNWEKYNITNVYKAFSGEQALKIIESTSIDVVITDIRMPDMSGLDLIKKAKRGKLRQYIVLSGYAEFEYAKEALDLSVCSYLLKPADDQEIEDAVQKAITEIQKNQDLFQQMMNHMPNFEQEVEVIPFESLYKKPQLIDLMNYREWEEVRIRIALIFKDLSSNQFQAPEFVLQAYFFITNTLIYFSHQQGSLLSDLFKDNFEVMHRAAYSGQIEKLKYETEEVLNKIITSSKKEKSTSYATVVEQVNRYIEENIQYDIYLQEVAKTVFLHPVYLSKIYKNEMGIAFSDYVMKKKMEKASELLTNSNKKIYKVSEELGYKDASYFNRKFKEYYGATPQDYRMSRR